MFNLTLESAQVKFTAYAPSILAEAFIATKNTSIGQAFGGLGLAAGGLAAIKASGIAQHIYALCHHQDSHINKLPLRRQMLHWTVASLGAAAVIAGIYNAATGILYHDDASFSRVRLAEPTTLKPDQSTHQAFEIPRELNGKISCKKLLNNALNLLHRCPDAVSQINKVRQQGEFSIHCTSSSAAPCGAEIDFFNRTIYVTPNTPPRMVSNILFETINLRAFGDFEEITKKICCIGPDVYVRKIDTLEYETVKKVNKIAVACIQKKVWPEETNLYESQLLGLPGHLNRSTLEKNLESEKGSFHSALYIRDWYRACQPEKLGPWLEQMRCQYPTWPL